MVGLHLASHEEAAEVMTDYIMIQVDTRLGETLPAGIRESLTREHILVLQNLENHGYILCKPVTKELF